MWMEMFNYFLFFSMCLTSFLKRNQRDIIIEFLNVEMGNGGERSLSFFFLMVLDEKKHSNKSVHEISFGIIIYNRNRKKISESPICTYMLISFPPKY